MTLDLVVGATAAGKSAVALAVAEALGHEVVNADATALYRGLDIGSSKPTAEDRARVPHHLLDVCDPRDACTVVDYQRLAYAAIDGRRALMVGGSGLYVRAVVEGYVFPEAPPDAALRARLESVDPAENFARLTEVDPKAAARTHRNNIRRVVRALEVYEQTGRPLSAWEDARSPRYAVRCVGVRRERELLYSRIDARIDQMFEAGLTDEVRGLLDAGVPRDAVALQAIGYKEVVPVVLGDADRTTAVDEMRRNTRKLARQQLKTWFRADDPNITWVDTAEEAIRVFE